MSSHRCRSLLDARSAICGITNEQGKAEEVIKDFKVANPTFPFSESDFILHNWLTLYCNSMVDQVKKKKINEAKKQGLAPLLPKKNIQLPPQKHKIEDAKNILNEVADDRKLKDIKNILNEVADDVQDSEV
ncbi:15797_t:CDS:2 [Funneliformis caledonium]|uniref:15797_t:CDS:1 n=1 Tax=Funneliformis caledonium TaxID=1117310 RepID=A0A9N9G078_9GLOM|nr:15797_t:CDS:2 [Funneliformis caledonium]